jgi:hypothetical protein
MLKIIIIIIIGYTLNISLLISQYYSKRWEKSKIKILKTNLFFGKNKLFVLSDVETDPREGYGIK